MRLSDKSITKLQELIMEAYGKSLTDEEAQAMGLRIVRYVYVNELTETVHKKTKGL